MFAKQILIYDNRKSLKWTLCRLLGVAEKFVIFHAVLFYEVI